jgi:hypothetical protein
VRSWLAKARFAARLLLQSHLSLTSPSDISGQADQSSCWRAAPDQAADFKYALLILLLALQLQPPLVEAVDKIDVMFPGMYIPPFVRLEWINMKRL